MIKTVGNDPVVDENLSSFMDFVYTTVNESDQSNTLFTQLDEVTMTSLEQLIPDNLRQLIDSDDVIWSDDTYVPVNVWLMSKVEDQDTISDNIYDFMDYVKK